MFNRMSDLTWAFYYSQYYAKPIPDSDYSEIRLALLKIRLHMTIHFKAEKEKQRLDNKFNEIIHNYGFKSTTYSL